MSEKQSKIAAEASNPDERDRTNWQVLRQDDHGNQFLIKSGISESEARAMQADLEAHGHKQMYWAEPMRPLIESKTEKFQRIIEKIASDYKVAPNMVSVAKIVDLDLDEQKKAIFFCHAAWSGPSRLGLRLLLFLLAACKSQAKVFVIDSDELARDPSTIEKACRLFGPVVGGWGEACWIKNGKIVGRELLGKPGTRELDALLEMLTGTDQPSGSLEGHLTYTAARDLTAMLENHTPD